MQVYLRKAEMSDVDRIWVILQQAVAQMLREGKHQWDETYPRSENIISDIENGFAHVLCMKPELTVENYTQEPSQCDTVIAYAAVVYSGEPAYEQPQLKWLSDQPFVVVHRLAVADEVKRQGVSKMLMNEVAKQAVSKGIHSFRLDTNYDNFYMQKMLASLEFSYTGECIYERCGARLCYEKLI
ncbi:MAG: GNAT family N-acetyltransferase [Bacteroidales bacterium]|nr:GNAT family N-acetyltransferase [Bacteroidales bacterium]